MSILMILLFLILILLLVSSYGVVVCSLKDTDCSDSSNVLTKLIGVTGVIFSVFLLCQTLALINDKLRLIDPDKPDSRRPPDSVTPTEVRKDHKEADRHIRQKK